MVWLCILQERMNDCMHGRDVEIQIYISIDIILAFVYHKLVLFVFDTHYVNVYTSIDRNNL